LQLNHFGDIPKRPLFLEMIIQDATDGKLKETFLSELYERYFFHKFVWDTESKFDEIPAGRPLTYSDDLYKGFQEMCYIMESKAGKMIGLQEGGDYYLKSNISENELEPLLLESKISNLNTLLLNSILTTTDARTIEGIRVEFAHRSFQEYFTARYFYNLLLADYENCKKFLMSVISGAVPSFLINYIEWKDSTQKSMSHENFKKIFSEQWPTNSLGDYVTIPLLKRVKV